MLHRFWYLETSLHFPWATWFHQVFCIFTCHFLSNLGTQKTGSGLLPNAKNLATRGCYLCSRCLCVASLGNSILESTHSVLSVLLCIKICPWVPLRGESGPWPFCFRDCWPLIRHSLVKAFVWGLVHIGPPEHSLLMRILWILTWFSWSFEGHSSEPI